MIQENAVALLDGKFCQFLGTGLVEESQYPVEMFMDVTDPEDLVIHVEFTDWGFYRYPLRNIRSIATVQPAIRKAIRAYEDYVIAKWENNSELGAPEEAFLTKWLLSGA